MYGNDRNTAKVTDKRTAQDAAAQTEAVLAEFGGYMWTICRGHLNDPDDAHNAFQDAGMKFFRCFLRGAKFDSEQQRKTYVWRATKGAVQEVLRRKHGRRKKNGPEKPARPTEIPLSAALERLSCTSLSIEESRLLVDEWAELIHAEAGYDVAIVFKLKAELLTEAEIAEKLGERLRVVKRRLEDAWKVLARHLQRRRG